MSQEARPAAETSTTGLLGGIISDFGNLIRQEVRFAKAEIKSDFGKTKQASVTLGIGAALAFLAVLLLCWMLVHLLHWVTLPKEASNYDPAFLPLWACFGIVGVVFGIAGYAMISAALKKFQSFNPLPDQAVQNLTENVQWIANSK